MISAGADAAAHASVRLMFMPTPSIQLLHRGLFATPSHRSLSRVRRMPVELGFWRVVRRSQPLGSEPGAAGLGCMDTAVVRGWRLGDGAGVLCEIPWSYLKAIWK